MKDVRDREMKKIAQAAEGQQDDAGVWGLFLLVILLVLVFSAAAQAETQAASAGSVKTEVQAPKRFKYTGSFALETARTLTENDSESWSGNYMTSLGVADKDLGILATMSLAYAREYSYELEDGEDGDLQNPRFNIAKVYCTGRDPKRQECGWYSFGLSGNIGISRESRRRSYLGEVGPFVSMKKVLGKFEIVQTLGYSRRFFEYDIRQNGVVNSPDGFRSNTSVTYALTDSLSLSGSLLYVYSISFQDVGRGAETTQVSADYAVNENTGVSLGVATERASQEADGQTDRLKFFDQDNAQAFFSIEIRI